MVVSHEAKEEVLRDNLNTRMYFTRTNLVKIKLIMLLMSLKVMGYS